MIGRDRGSGALMIPHAVVVGPLNSHLYEAGTIYAGCSLQQVCNHQARNTVIQSMIRKKTESFFTRMVRPKVYYLSCMAEVGRRGNGGSNGGMFKGSLPHNVLWQTED